MRLKVTDAGVIIPRDMLQQAEEVDVRKEGNTVVITPVGDENDPIWQMGSDPVTCGVSDAASNHDVYIYQSLGEPIV
jgi:virulence-associated protein VagC